jgi:hypothetical protein
MISFKRLSNRKNEGEADAKSGSPMPSARESWGALVEPMYVNGESVYALTFHLKGTALYFLHKHYRSRQDAEDEFMRITHDLDLPRSAFETKYRLDLHG